MYTSYTYIYIYIYIYKLSLTYKYIHYLTGTLLNNSVELSSNLDPEPLKSGLRTPLLTQSIELLSGSIGWGAGLQSSRLVQSKGSNPLKVL